MTLRQDLDTYFLSIKESLSCGKNKYKTLRVKAIMQHFGFRRRSQVFIDEFNDAVNRTGLYTTPILSTLLPIDQKVYVLLKDSLNAEEESKQKNSITHNKENELGETLFINHDIFYYLFDFDFEHEYERFQAALDSNQPVGIFLIPDDKDFFSDVIMRILSYELIRKYQYQGTNGTPTTSRQTLPEKDSLVYDDTLSVAASVHNTGLLKFDRLTMANVILGETGFELINSEKFDERFEQISLYSNKYNIEQFFVIFQCPSRQEIYSRQKEDVLSSFIERVSNQIPLTFALKCKYSSEELIENYQEIFSHLRLLMEVPRFQSSEDSKSLITAFLEIHKTQLQAESQLFLKLNANQFNVLTWGYESDEHIYLKYFAIRTLESLGYDLDKIQCEVAITSKKDLETSLKSGKTSTDETINPQDVDPEEDITRRPDVYIENQVIVEVETLRGKGLSSNKVFLDLVDRILGKSTGWPSCIREIWIVLPGFEIARNYLQVKKAQEILSKLLFDGNEKKPELKIMAPDYENHYLVPVSFEQVNYPSFSSKPSIASLKSANPKVVDRKAFPTQEKLTFADVAGLSEEKGKLQKILRLQEKGHLSGVNGILLYGLPGCGKTLLAKAFANEASRYFFKFTPADVQSMYIGESQRKIQQIFAQAAKRSPSLLFIDELDSIGFNRSDSHSHTDQRATINQLLIEMQDVRCHDVIVIAATNYISGIDNALKRSGRLDWKIPIFPPNESEREEVFKLYFSKMQIQKNAELVDFRILAASSSKFSSSDIESVCNEIRTSILLGEIESSLTTSDVIIYIENMKDGGLSINQEQVQEFLDECRRMSIKSSKLSSLKEEWNL